MLSVPVDEQLQLASAASHINLSKKGFLFDKFPHTFLMPVMIVRRACDVYFGLDNVPLKSHICYFSYKFHHG